MLCQYTDGVSSNESPAFILRLSAAMRAYCMCLVYITYAYTNVA